MTTPDLTISIITNDWTNEAENDFKKIQDTLLVESQLYLEKSKRYHKLHKGLQLGIFLSSSCNIILSSSALPCEIKQYTSIATGILCSTITGIFAMMDFSKLFIIHRDISVGLESLARKIQTELYKPPTQRSSPYIFMLMIESVQQKIMKKLLDIK